MVRIIDGDTIEALPAGAREPVRVRLASIDPPERRQPYGNAARQALAALVFRKTVRIEDRGKDRYGRTLGVMWLGAMSVNAEMVRLGAAWVFRRYEHDPAILAIEAEARQSRRGLWALQPDQIVPPWEWRHRD